MPARASDRGFTLIELLVVIAIIAILAAILFPVFAKAREKANQNTCLSNQRQINIAILMWAQDHGETLPTAAVAGRALAGNLTPVRIAQAPGGGNLWSELNLEKGLLTCPTAAKQLAGRGYGYAKYLSGVTVGALPDPMTQVVTADGGDENMLLNTGADVEKRHGRYAVVSYADGHVGQISALGMDATLFQSDISSQLFDGQEAWTADARTGGVVIDAGAKSIQINTVTSATPYGRGLLLDFDPIADGLQPLTAGQLVFRATVPGGQNSMHGNQPSIMVVFPSVTDLSAYEIAFPPYSGGFTNCGSLNGAIPNKWQGFIDYGTWSPTFEGGSTSPASQNSDGSKMMPIATTFTLTLSLAIGTGKSSLICDFGAGQRFSWTGNAVTGPVTGIWCGMGKIHSSKMKFTNITLGRYVF